VIYLLFLLFLGKRDIKNRYTNLIKRNIQANCNLTKFGTMAEKCSRFRETQDELQAMPQITLNDY